MEVSGKVNSQAAKQQAWQAIMTVDNWKQIIPDVSKLESTGEHSYEMVVKVEIGPIKGNQTIHIDFSNLNAPNSGDFMLKHAMIKSVKGHLDFKDQADGEVLTDNAKTVVHYKLDIDAGNPFFNAALDGYKGMMQQGFEELLRGLLAKA